MDWYGENYNHFKLLCFVINAFQGFWLRFKRHRKRFKVDIEPFSGLSKESRSLNLEIRSMLLLLSSMNTWAAQNSSWSAHIIVSEVSCGPWNVQVGCQVAYLDLKLRFTVSICNLLANLRIPRATLDFRKNDVHRSWTVSCSPCIHFVSEEEHWKTIHTPLIKKRFVEICFFTDDKKFSFQSFP